MRGRAVAVGLLGVGYVAGCQWLMTSAPPSRWEALAVIGPMLALLGWWAASRGRRWLAVLAGVGLVVLAVQAWRGGGFDPEGVYVAQRVVVYAALAMVFGATLRRGRESLITSLARRVHHGHLTTAMEVYSRKVTIAWTLCFAVIALASLLLFAGATFEAWAAFSNFVAPAAMLLLFVGEHAFRYWLHPEFERASLRDMVQAYSERHAAPAEPRP